MGGIELSGEEVVRELATMSANQANATTVLVSLAVEVKESREAAQRSADAVSTTLGKISSTQSGFAVRLDEHIKNDDERIDRLWLVLKWAGGIGTIGGLTVGGSKIASGMGLF